MYRLPEVGVVCRACWILAAGYLNKNNTRVRNTEANIRKGSKAPETNVFNKRRDKLNLRSYCEAFLVEYIFKASQYSPSDTTLFVDFCGLRLLYEKYKKDCRGKRCLKFSAFVITFKSVLLRGVTDPETSVHYKVHIRKSRSKGFSKCNVCMFYKMKRAGTDNITKKAEYSRKLQVHIQQVMDDRDELARVQRLCMTNKKHAGFYIDAADSCKFQMPTTKDTAKCLQPLWRIRQKLTLVQSFDIGKSLHIFRTLPNVPTGANLTATIITRLFNMADLRTVEDLYINVDGAGDNINYTFVYFLIHILLSAQRKGWPLTRIHLFRMKVGHTHCDVDATVAILSRCVYGKHARGDPCMDIFSFKSFKEVRARTHTHTHTHTHTTHLLVIHIHTGLHEGVWESTQDF